MEIYHYVDRMKTLSCICFICLQFEDLVLKIGIALFVENKFTGMALSQSIERGSMTIESWTSFAKNVVMRSASYTI